MVDRRGRERGNEMGMKKLINKLSIDVHTELCPGAACSMLL